MVTVIRDKDIVQYPFVMKGKFIRELYNCSELYEYNAILQCFCVGYTDTLTMSVPLQAIKSMGADKMVARNVLFSNIENISTEVHSLQ